ncbi:unnamed protein product [Gordionus sp. m RMFG-2023]
MMCIHISFTGSIDGVYYSVESLVQLFQTLAILELFHAIFGLVKSSPTFVFLQLFGRLFIVWVTFYEPYQVTSDLGSFFIILAWSITENIRYSYYAWTIYNSNTLPYLMIWLRYNAFIVLYPIGVLGEVLTTVSAWDYLSAWSLYPIQYESSIIYFNMAHLVLILTIPYFIGFFFLYTYMLKQRKKVLTNLQSPKWKDHSLNGNTEKVAATGDGTNLKED